MRTYLFGAKVIATETCSEEGIATVTIYQKRDITKPVSRLNLKNPVRLVFTNTQDLDKLIANLEDLRDSITTFGINQ